MVAAGGGEHSAFGGLRLLVDVHGPRLGFDLAFGRGHLFRLVVFFSHSSSLGGGRFVSGRLDRDFGRGAFDGRRRTLACTALAGVVIAEWLYHRALTLSPSRIREPQEDAAFELRSARTSSARLWAATRTRNPSGANISATASEMQ